jgi:hypothetical protein
LAADAYISRAGLPARCYNFIGFDHAYARAAGPLAPGKHSLRYEFTYDGGVVGKGGIGTLFIDGNEGPDAP